MEYDNNIIIKRNIHILNIQHTKYNRTSNDPDNDNDDIFPARTLLFSKSLRGQEKNKHSIRYCVSYRN